MQILFISFTLLLPFLYMNQETVYEGPDFQILTPNLIACQSNQVLKFKFHSDLFIDASGALSPQMCFFPDYAGSIDMYDRHAHPHVLTKLNGQTFDQCINSLNGELELEMRVQDPAITELRSGKMEYMFNGLRYPVVNKIIRFHYFIHFKPAPIRMVSITAENNQFNQTSCLELVFANPCVQLLPNTKTILTFPSSPQNQDKIYPLRVFNDAECDVTLNGIKNSKLNCSVNGDELQLNDLFNKIYDGNYLTLRLCSIQMNNFNHIKSNIKFIQFGDDYTKYDAPWNLQQFTDKEGLYAETSFTIETNVGDISIINETAINTMVFEEFLIRIGLLAEKRLYLNVGNVFSIDFTKYPQTINKLSFVFYNAGNSVQSGDLVCKDNICTTTLTTDISLQDEFKIDIDAKKDVFNKGVQFLAYVKLVNGEDIILKKEFSFKRIVSRISGTIDERDTGLLSNLNIKLEGLEENENDYVLVLDLKNTLSFSIESFEGIYIDNERVPDESLSFNEKDNLISITGVNSKEQQRDLIITYKGLIIGPFESGFNSILYTVKNNDKVVIEKSIDLQIIKNEFQINSINVQNSPQRNRMNITLTYIEPIYVDHYLKIGVPSHYIISNDDWEYETQIPHENAFIIESISDNKNSAVSYYRIDNIFERTKNNVEYYLSFLFTKKERVIETGDIEISLITALDGFSLDNKINNKRIGERVFSSIDFLCPKNCLECNSTSKICQLCAIDYYFKEEDGLCHLIKEETITEDDKDNENDDLNKEKNIKKFSKILEGFTINTLILLFFITLLQWSFYKKTLNIIEFLCAYLTGIYSMISYLFLIRILTETGSDKEREVLAYAVIFCTLYFSLNLFSTIYFYIKNRNSIVKKLDIVNIYLMKIIFFFFIVLLGSGCCLILNSYHLIDLYKKLYAEEDEIKIYKDNIEFLKWFNAINILSFSIGIIVMVFKGDIQYWFSYFYIVICISIFFLFLTNIWINYKTTTKSDKLYNTKKINDLSKFIAIGEEERSALSFTYLLVGVILN